jgi:two-component system CheB/CheR fusion protein
MTKRKTDRIGKSKAAGKRPAPARPTAPRPGPSLVIAVGASAGGLEAYKAFFSLMPPDSGMIFVLIQHLDPKRPSMLVDILGAVTRMPVVQAEDGAGVAANHVYVIPPDATLTMEEGELRVTRPAPPREARRPIDAFFTSLAEDQGDNAVCIVLSGGGSDGSEGLRAIKERGGFTLAQAEFDHQAKSGMPSSAAATGLVDEVMPVEAMPTRLLAYQRHLAAVRGQTGSDGVLGGDADVLARICRQVRSGVGHDFSQYKDRTLMRRIQRRMQVTQAASLKDYADKLRKDPHEVRLLFQEFLIGVTGFFRDPEAYAALQAEVVPNLFAGKGADDAVRLWVAGCSTGEEAYSLAILLREHIGSHNGVPKVQIFATDIDEEAVAFARAGKYRLAQLGGVSAERRKKWFMHESDHWCPIKEIREMCVFSLHGAIKDPPFSKLDLVSCRNLLIYLQPPAQERLISAFQYALKPGGYLFLGASESLARQSKAFLVVNKKHRVFRRRDTNPATLPDLANYVAARPGHVAPPAVSSGEDRLDINARRTMEKHFPAYVVVDLRNEVVRFAGPVAKFLGPSPGAASLDLYALLLRPLRSPARALLQKVLQERQAAVQKGLAVEIDGALHFIDLIVEPIAGSNEPGFMALAFVDRGPAPRTGVEDHAEGNESDVEHELAVMRERLQATIDELETNNEEMKSANEEFQSVNEELQSTNEELETSKEELQSINEELQTVNSELHSKNDTLLRLNSDLKNFLDSTEIATMFLDAQLRVTNFTPTMTELFHLRESDHERPITEIASRLDYGDLVDDVARVLRGLTPIEREVSVPRSGRTFTMRIRPYRRIDNVIDGTVITFNEITDRKRGEAERLHRSQLVQSSNDAIIGTSLKGVITSWNLAAERLYGFSAEEAVGQPVTIITPPDRRDDEDRILQRVRRGESIDPFATVRRRKDGSLLNISLRVSPIRDADGKVTGASTIARDDTERMRADARQNLLTQELNHRVKNTLATVQSIAAQTLADESDPKGFQDRFSKRLATLARTHNALAQGDWRGARLDDLFWAELAPYCEQASNRCVAEGPPIDLAPNAALAIGMALHELATNAAKYGAFSTPGGRVKALWEIDRTNGAAKLRFEWREDGGPPVNGRPARQGFGSRLIERGLTYQLNGEAKLNFESSGVRFVLEAPLASVEAGP